MMRLVWLTFAAVFLLATGAQAQTLERVRERHLQDRLSRGRRPFSFRDTLGEPAGYSVQLCRLIAAQVKQALGLDKISIEYVPVGTEDRFQAVQDGRIDILCSADTVTLSRRELVDFSLFTFLDGAAVLLRADGPEEFEGLVGQKIGVRDATTTEEALRNTLAGRPERRGRDGRQSRRRARQAGGGRDRSVLRRSGDLDLPCDPQQGARPAQAVEPAVHLRALCAGARARR